MARPLKEINWELVEKLIEAGCNGVAIAGKFRIQDDTFYRRFKQQYGVSFQDYKAPVSSAGQADILLMQHAKALNNRAPGNAQMLIWLGKVRLGQKEPEVTTSIAPNQSDIDKDHLIMKLQYKIAQLEANAEQLKAN